MADNKIDWNAPVPSNVVKALRDACAAAQWPATIEPPSPSSWPTLPLNEADMIRPVDGKDVAELLAIAKGATAPDSAPKDKGGRQLGIVAQRMLVLAAAWVGENGIPERRQDLVNWLAGQCEEQLAETRLKEIAKLACETYAAYLKSGR